jgi:CRP/FNR family transcriptional regulator, cyclic AMP receptor protein
LNISIKKSQEPVSLSPEILKELEMAALPFAIGRDQTLFRQGMASDALYLITSGELSISTRIPGDMAAAVQNIGPGSIVGELAMLDDGPRSADVKAARDTKGWLIPKSQFLAIVAAGKPWALALIDSLRGLVAERTRSTLLRIIETKGYELPALREPGFYHPSSLEPNAGPLFAALGRLADFGHEGSTQLAAMGDCIHIPRGARLSEAETSPNMLTIVLRGALRAVLPRCEGNEQVMVHGPGEIAGLIGLFANCSHPLGLEAAESSVALQLSPAVFDDMRQSPDPLAISLFVAIGRQLVRDQRRVNRHLGRAISMVQFNTEPPRNAF